jgi:hypothetical protein
VKKGKQMIEIVQMNEEGVTVIPFQELSIVDYSELLLAVTAELNGK